MLVDNLIPIFGNVNIKTKKMKPPLRFLLILVQGCSLQIIIQLGTKKRLVISPEKLV